jgi:hypothetical protein
MIPPRTGGNMGTGYARAFDPNLYRSRNVIEPRCLLIIAVADRAQSEYPI